MHLRPSFNASFNTCPHAGGNNHGGTGVCANKRVSIHAPTRGATTAEPIVSSSHWQRFQYMPPRGGQQRRDFSTIIGKHPVSIHAPTRGATTKALDLEQDSISFNTCPHAGGNNFSACLLMTLSCGFNTCPHAGGNNVLLLITLVCLLTFQYMPPRGGQQLQR